MKYPRVYDISSDARIVLGFYVRGVTELKPHECYARENKELLERRYIKIEDGNIIILVKHPRTYKRDRWGNIIKMKMDNGKNYYPTWR